MAKPDPEPAVESGAREDAWREREGERLLVVGIGASAGGLEAFERFLGRVPPDSGLAYVLVQHLDPEHESILAEILGRATRLPVEIAKDAQRIERDHVYVIPQRAGLLVEGGALRVVAAEPGGNRLLLNAFFTSLAEDQGENAVGVVLSGNRLRRRPRHRRREEARREDVRAAPLRREVREHAGRRDRDRAWWIRCSPSRRSPRRSWSCAAERRRHPSESVRGGEEGLRQAFDVVARATGHDFSRYKRSTVLRRFHRRMAATGTATVRDYAAPPRSGRRRDPAAHPRT